MENFQRSGVLWVDIHLVKSVAVDISPDASNDSVKGI